MDFWKMCLLEGSGELVNSWLIASPVPVALAKNRRSKHGDFRAPRQGRPALITINHDLHPVEFLITLAHEIAHFRNWKKFGRRVRPHGAAGSSEQLNRLLGKMVEDSGVLRVADLPEGTRFTLRSGKSFIKGRKLRKRYQCRDAVSSRIYSVHPMAEVKETLVS
ncbi:MAG: hypothetical protein NTV01_13460 [Bacteroidia bacterium]|nr:hypothetical protein [Bacteroidia bacterium]